MAEALLDGKSVAQSIARLRPSVDASIATVPPGLSPPSGTSTPKTCAVSWLSEHCALGGAVSQLVLRYTRTRPSFVPDERGRATVREPAVAAAIVRAADIRRCFFFHEMLEDIAVSRTESSILNMAKSQSVSIYWERSCKSYGELLLVTQESGDARSIVIVACRLVNVK